MDNDDALVEAMLAAWWTARDSYGGQQAAMRAALAVARPVVRREALGSEAVTVLVTAIEAISKHDTFGPGGMLIQIARFAEDRYRALIDTPSTPPVATPDGGKEEG